MQNMFVSSDGRVTGWGLRMWQQVAGFQVVGGDTECMQRISCLSLQQTAGSRAVNIVVVDHPPFYPFLNPLHCVYVLDSRYHREVPFWPHYLLLGGTIPTHPRNICGSLAPRR